jgi:hypothetical protein
MLVSPLNARVGRTRPGPMFGAVAPGRQRHARGPVAAALRSLLRSPGRRSSQMVRTVFVGACLAVVVLSVSGSTVLRRAARAGAPVTAVAARSALAEWAARTRGRPLTQWLIAPAKGICTKLRAERPAL